MVREMITLPLRLGAFATRIGVHLTARAAGVAVGVAGQLIARSVPAQSHSGAAAPRASSGTFELDVVIASSPRPPEAAPAAAPASAPAVPEPDVLTAPGVAPAHVSEELQFVEAFAEPGAEEGAGAAVHVREPWHGYPQMTASEVILRLTGTSPEELAAVVLYEGVHRRRKTVLAEASRQLRSATANRSPAHASRV